MSLTVGSDDLDHDGVGHTDWFDGLDVSLPPTTVDQGSWGAAGVIAGDVSLPLDTWFDDHLFAGNRDWGVIPGWQKYPDPQTPVMFGAAYLHSPLNYVFHSTTLEDFYVIFDSSATEPPILDPGVRDTATPLTFSAGYSKTFVDSNPFFFPRGLTGRSPQFAIHRIFGTLRVAHAEVPLNVNVHAAGIAGRDAILSAYSALPVETRVKVNGVQYRHGPGGWGLPKMRMRGGVKLDVSGWTASSVHGDHDPRLIVVGDSAASQPHPSSFAGLADYSALQEVTGNGHYNLDFDDITWDDGWGPIETSDRILWVRVQPPFLGSGTTPVLGASSFDYSNVFANISVSLELRFRTPQFRFTWDRLPQIPGSQAAKDIQFERAKKNVY